MCCTYVYHSMSLNTIDMEEDSTTSRHPSLVCPQPQWPIFLLPFIPHTWQTWHLWILWLGNQQLCVDCHTKNTHAWVFDLRSLIPWNLEVRFSSVYWLLSLKDLLLLPWKILKLVIWPLFLLWSGFFPSCVLKSVNCFASMIVVARSCTPGN